MTALVTTLCLLLIVAWGLLHEMFRDRQLRKRTDRLLVLPSGRQMHVIRERGKDDEDERLESLYGMPAWGFGTIDRYHCEECGLIAPPHRGTCSKSMMRSGKFQ